jgi:glycosyltransferase involved in cell wall biosynthesis
MREILANKMSRDDLGLDPQKPTIFVATDSPCIHTGLAKICRNVVGHLYKTGKYNIVQHAWWHREPVEDVPWPLLLTLRNSNGVLDPHDRYGNVTLNRVLTEIQQGTQGIVTWISGDPWMILPVTARRQVIRGPIISYLAVDGGPLDRDSDTSNTVGWYQVCSNSDVVVPYLPWGRDLLRDAFPTANIAEPISPGVDTSIFRPLEPDERDEMRRVFFKNVEGGMFCSIARNQYRKNLPENIRALYFLRGGKYSVCNACGRYNLWRRDYIRLRDIGPEPACKFCGHADLKPGEARPELVYYMHTPLDEVMDDSWRLPDLLNQFEMIRDGKLQGVLVNDALKSVHGETEQNLARYIASCDAYAMPSLGEGMGMPALEALACGVQVVASDYSAHPDFLRGIARLVPCSYQSCEPATNYWRGFVDPGQVPCQSHEVRLAGYQQEVGTPYRSVPYRR